MNTKNNIINSFIIVPLVATTLSMSAFTSGINAKIAELSNKNKPTIEEVRSNKERLEKAAKIDAYFAKYDLPLAGYGMAMVMAAERHGLDWKLIPSIAMRESTGCKFIIQGTYNCFGWGGGKIKFASYEDAIEQLASHLGGNEPSTAHWYKGKDIENILKTYNPPYVVATYANEVIAIMNSIEKTQV